MMYTTKVKSQYELLYILNYVKIIKFDKLCSVKMCNIFKEVNH
jgi:hypothetical protein